MTSAKFTPWIPFGFALTLSAIVMIVSLTMQSFEPSFPAFFCFLPMAFFFVAMPLLRSQQQIRDLQDRIQQLEARNASS